MAEPTKSWYRPVSAIFGSVLGKRVRQQDTTQDATQDSASKRPKAVPEQQEEGTLQDSTTELGDPTVGSGAGSDLKSVAKSNSVDGAKRDNDKAADAGDDADADAGVKPGLSSNGTDIVRADTKPVVEGDAESVVLKSTAQGHNDGEQVKADHGNSMQADITPAVPLLVEALRQILPLASPHSPSPPSNPDSRDSTTEDQIARLVRLRDLVSVQPDLVGEIDAQIACLTRARIAATAGPVDKSDGSSTPAPPPYAPSQLETVVEVQDDEEAHDDDGGFQVGDDKVASEQQPHRRKRGKRKTQARREAAARQEAVAQAAGAAANKGGPVKSTSGAAAKDRASKSSQQKRGEWRRNNVADGKARKADKKRATAERQLVALLDQLRAAGHDVKVHIDGVTPVRSTRDSDFMRQYEETNAGSTIATQDFAGQVQKSVGVYDPDWRRREASLGGETQGADPLRRELPYGQQHVDDDFGGGDFNGSDFGRDNFDGNFDGGDFDGNFAGDHFGGGGSEHSEPAHGDDASDSRRLTTRDHDQHAGRQQGFDDDEPAATSGFAQDGGQGRDSEQVYQPTHGLPAHLEAKAHSTHIPSTPIFYASGSTLAVEWPQDLVDKGGLFGAEGFGWKGPDLTHHFISPGQDAEDEVKVRFAIFVLLHVAVSIAAVPRLRPLIHFSSPEVLSILDHFGLTLTPSPNEPGAKRVSTVIRYRAKDWSLAVTTTKPSDLEQNERITTFRSATKSRSRYTMTAITVIEFNFFSV